MEAESVAKRALQLEESHEDSSHEEVDSASGFAGGSVEGYSTLVHILRAASRCACPPQLMCMHSHRMCPHPHAYARTTMHMLAQPTHVPAPSCICPDHNALCSPPNECAPTQRVRYYWRIDRPPLTCPPHATWHPNAYASHIQCICLADPCTCPPPPTPRGR